MWLASPFMRVLCKENKSFLEEIILYKSENYAKYEMSKVININGKACVELKQNRFK